MSPTGGSATTAAAPAAVVLQKTDRPPLPAFPEHQDSRARGQQPVDAFAALKQRAATALFERMGTRFNDSATTEEDLRTSAREELTRIIDAEQVPLSAEERSRLVRDVADDVLGYGPLQRLLDDPAVTEIMVNRMDQIYVERNGKLTLTESRFSSEDHLRKVIERIVSKVGRRIDESSPLVDARLEDGSRVNAVIPPLAVGGSSLTIRKFSKVPLTVRNLIEFGTTSFATLILQAHDRIQKDDVQMTLKLSLGITPNPRTYPVIEGRVKAESIEFLPSVLHPSELFWRQLRFSEFDVSEMSISSLMIARSKGDDRFVGIPVFTTRKFFHTTTLVPQRRQDRQALGPQGQARRRAGISADRGAVVARRAAARIRRRAEGHGILDGAAALAQPRRRDRLQAAARRHRQPDPGREEHRLDDGLGRTRCRDLLSARSQPGRSQHHRLCTAIRTSSRCFRIPGPRACATTARPASSRSTTAW